MAGKNTVDAKTYAKNVLKSAKYIGVQTIKGVNPTLTDYVSDNVQLSKDMYSEVKNFKTTIKNKLNSVLGETGFEDLKAVKGNFFSDLKTGKFYNPEREEENETKTLSKMGFSFDFDFDDLDFDVDENYTSDKEESQSTNTNILANKLSFSQQKSSMASAELIVGGATRNTRATLAHTEKMFGTVNRSLSAINSSILAMHSDLATPLNAHIQNSTAFYQTATNELAKQTSYLENINKLITDRFTPTTKPGFKNSGKASPWEEIMGGGMPNIRAIGSLVKNRTINSPEMSMLTSMLSPEMAQMFLGMGLSSPVALLMSSLFGGAIKRGPIGKSLDRTLKTIQGGSIKVASRIHNYNQKAKGQGFLGMLANIFDIIPQKAGKMDFGNYNKGRADWTGKDSKALQDVIPTQLSEIITLLSGKPAKIFDYETGKWKSAKDVRADFSRARIKNFGNADSSFKEEILKEFIDEDFYNPENIKNKTPRYTMNSRAVRSLSKDYDMLITLLSTKGVSLSKYTKAQDLITDCKKFGWVGPDALLGEDNLKTLAKIIFKRRTNVTRFEGAVYTGRLSDARFVESNTGGAFANIANGSNLGTAHSTGIGLLANSVDEDKHNVFYYLSNILKEIKGFKPTGGFGKPSSGRTDTASERQRTPVRSNVVTSSELIDDWIVNDRENRYTDDDTEGRQVYNSETKRYENYKGPAAMSRHTRELKAEREEKTNFISRGIDKFNSALESIMYGDAGEAIKKKYREAGGLFGIVKNLPEIIKKGVDIVKDFLKDKWNKFKDSGFGKAYFGEMKNSIKNFAKDTFEYGKSRAKDAANWLKTGWSADIVADPPKAAKGGYVKKSGMASVSEGELIIPANKNPFYKGKMSNKQRDNIENLNLLNWIKDGAPGGSFMGSYADGGTVKDPKKKLTLDQLKAKVQGRVNRNKEEYDDTHWPNLNKKQKKALINMARHGFTDEEIARHMTLDIRQVRQILNKNAVSENLNKFGNTVKTGAKKAGGFIKDKLDAWLGDSKTYKNVKDATGEVVRASKVNLPKTFASGTLGALVGAAATGSGIGLLGGLVIGAGTEVLRNSDKISKFLFGEKDKDGNYTGGKLHPKLTKFIKEKLPKTAKAGAIGGVFGALGLAPGGIFGGMAIGAGLDLLSTTSKFQDLMFGKVSADGKRKGGLVRSLKINIVDPLTTFVKDGIGKVGTFFKEEIFNPIKSIFKPIKDRATGKMLAVKDSMTSFASDKVKAGAMYLMDSILGSTSRKVGKAGKFGIKLGSKILAAPAKMVGGIANRMSYVNAKKGYSSLSPEERMNIINNGTGIGYAIIDVVGMGVTTITDTITNIVKKIGSTIFKGLKIIGSKISGFFKKVFSPAIDYIKEEILSPVKDFVSNQIFKPIKNFIKDKIVKNIKEKVVDRAKKFFADRRAKTPIMRYNKFAAENKDQILDMAHYLNGTNSFKRSQKAKRQNLLNTMLASLENGGMGDPDTIKSIKKAFNTKKLIEDNDFSDVINMVELLSSQNKIGDAEKNALYEVINRTKAEIQSEKAKQENFDENKTAFLTKYGFDLSKMKKRDVRKLKIQSQIDAKRITGTSLKDLDDLLINGRRQDKALALLKEQEQNNPLDYQRNQDLRTVRDTILSWDKVRDILLDWDYNVRRANAPLALPPGNPNNVQTASDIVNNATGSTPLALPPGNSNILALPAPSSASSPKKGDIKNEIVNGIPTQYVYDGKEWNLNTSDADTKESKEAIETKNKFYEMFVDGGLLSSLKGVFGFGKKDDKEEKTSFWDKIKDFFGGENGIFTSLFNALGGTGGIGSVLLRVLPGAIGAGLLTYGLGKYGQSSAGTGLDSGMYAGADAEARKAEVADMGGIKKVGLGINAFENKLRGRDTTTYNQDDYITQYETSRIGERMAKNALYSFNPTYAKRAQGVIRKTIGKVPFIGKPAAAVVGATNNVGALTKEVGKIATSGGIKNYLLEEVATTTNKKKAAILGGIYDAGENFSKKMKSAGKAIKNSKVGTAATNIFGKLKSTGLGKAASSAISKLKEKILNILKTVALKVGIKEASSEAMEEASKMAAREIVKRAGKNALKLAAKIVPIVNLVFIANAVLSGFQKAKAKTILGILDDPTVGQRVLAATLNGINEAIPGIGGIIPTEVLFSIMFTVLKWLGADFENLTEQRAEAKATVEAYNRENGTTYNVEEYIHNVLGEYTIQERITKGVSKGWDKVKSFFSSHKDDEETENSEFSNEVDTTIQSDSKKAATPGGFGSNDYNNPSGFGVDGPQQEAKGSGIFKNLNQYTTNSNYNLGAKGSGLTGGASGTYDFNNNINQIVRKTRNSNSYKDTMTSSSYSGFMSDSNTVDTKSLVAAQNIGGKVSALFENISAEIPDVTGMIGDLWKLSDPNNVKNNSYDKVLRKYKQRENSNSLMGGFGNSLVNSVSGVMKIVNSVVTPFRFMSSMMSGTLDDSSLARMNSVAGKGTGNIISNAFNSIKTFFSNGVNSVKGFFSNVGSGVSNAVSNTADAIKNFITGNSTGTSTGSGVGDGESYWSGGGTGNSPLVTVTKISPNKTSPRNHAIDTITIHCTAGPGTASQILDIFVPKSRKASCNYAIGYDGSIGLCVEEKDRSWCSSNAANDNRAITIEVSSENVAPYKVTDKAYNSLINLLIDVCRRNGIKKLLWKADARYVGNVSMQNMTVHRWFAAKACPGDYLYNLHGDIANAVNAGLGSTTATTTQNTTTTTTTAQAAIANIPSATSNLKNGPLNSGTKNGNTGAIMSTLNNSNWTSGNNAGSGSGVIPIHTSQIGNYARFGNTNIDQNGCGPAVASTVLKAYGKNVGIDTAAKYAEDRDYVAGASKVEGTRASYFSDILGSNGINTRYTDKTSDIKSSIKSGKPTILLGQDRSNKSKANSPFGPNPHYVVARGMDRRGNVIVDDPEQKRTTVYNRNIINNTKLGIATGRGWLDTVSGKINNVGRSLVDSFLDIGRTPATTTTNNKTTNNATNNKTKADNDPTATTDTSTTNATEVDTSMTTDTSTTATTTDSTSSSSSGTNGIQGFVSKAFGNVLGSVYNKLDPNSAAAKVFSRIFISNSSEDSSSSASDSGTYSGTGSANFTPIPLGAGTADLETVIPEKYRPLYNKTTSGGLSDCFSSNPSVADDKTKQKKYDVLPNCVGWAWGRFSHISSEINGGVKFYNRYRGNPGIDMFNGMAANGYETSTTTPKPGALIIWKGHIAVVESVLENGDIVRSESEYNGGKLLNTGTSTKASGYSYGSHGKAVGFVYNPYVKEYTDSGTGNSDANAKKVWSYLINKGMSKHGIAGLLGCWMVESAVTPKRIEADTSSSFPGYDVIQDPNQLSNWSVKACRINKGTLSGYKCKNGKYACGIGMAQWTADRTWSLVEYANNNNRKWYDLYCQLDFMLYEITEQYPSYYKSTYNALKNATSTDAATSTILRNYEGGGNNKLAQRQAYAREFYNKFANTTTRTNATLGAKGSGLLDDIFSTDAKTIAKYSSKSGGKSGSKANTTHVLKRSNILSGSINKYRGSASNIIKTSTAGSNDFTRSSANGKVFSNNYYRQINKIKGSASNILSSDQANGISTYRGNNYTAKMSDVILNGLVNDSNVDLNTYTVQDQQKQQILQTLNLTKITEYLDIIASNTKYNSSIPEIVKIISESLDTLSNINTNTSSTTTKTTRSTSRAAKAQDEADNYQAAIENKIKLMRAKLEAISKTL